MTTAAETRTPLAVADGLVQEAFALLALFCARLGVAGSIRRRRPDLGDLELVVPCYEPGHHDLFGVVVAEAPTRCTRAARSGSAVAPDGAHPLLAAAAPWETTGADTAPGATGALTRKKQAPEVDRFRGSSLVAASPLTPTRGSSDR